MFEKESEEYADYFWGASPSAQRAIKQAYQQGAEYGYNKCNAKLTKAKELLTRFIMGSVYFNGKETDLVEEAEQFLRKLEE